MPAAAYPTPRHADPAPREPGTSGEAATRPSDASPEAANESHGGVERSNLIKRTVDEMYALMTEMHEHREELFARGVSFHILNAMIETGAKGKIEDLQALIATAAQTSRDTHGSQAIDVVEMTERLSDIIVLEKDLRHVRHTATKQGVLMQALNPLTQLMRQNPGDRGVRSINTLIAYADAAGVDLSASRDILASIEQESASVLPNIDRRALEGEASPLAAMLQQVALGLLLTAIMFWFVV